jgi:hypothetical protein
MLEQKLSISSGASVDREQDCLSFRYRLIPPGPEEFRERTDIGILILTQIVPELQRNGYAISKTPAGGKKSFGTTGMKCRRENREFNVVVIPPEFDDCWQIRVSARTEPPSASEQKLSPTDDLHTAVYQVVSKLEGAHDLTWTSRAKAERRQA